MNHLMEGFPPASYQDWLNRVNKELKGEDFEAALVHNTEGIRIEPLYTTRPELEKPLAEDDTEDDFEIEDNSGPQWQAAEVLFIKNGDDVSSLLENAFNLSIRWLRIRGDLVYFLQSLVKGVPLPVSFCLEMPETPVDEETEKQLRDLILQIRAHQPLIYSLEFDPLTDWIHSGTCQKIVSTFDHLYSLSNRLQPHLTDCRFYRVDAIPAAEAGATAAYQLAYALSAANQYISELTNRGAELFEIAHQFLFRFSSGQDFFLEIAKLKAFRILWRNLLEGWDEDFDYFEHPAIHSSTSCFNMSTADKHNNLLRSTTAAMSAVLGGCDVLDIQPYEKGNSHADRMARNIHHLLRYESYLDQYAHAANGAFYIENLTRQLTELAWEQFKELENNGGFISCMQAGKIQADIANQRSKKMAAVSSGNEILVGINKYMSGENISVVTEEFQATEFPVLRSWNIEQSLNQHHAS
jgi:methylmalonyl-CoA mutase